MADHPPVDEVPLSASRCPICRRPSDPVLKPFCSKRCSDVDLHRWLAGSYRVPTEDEPDDGDEPGPMPRADT